MSRLTPEQTEILHRRYGFVVRSTEEFEQFLFDRYGISPILMEGDDGQLCSGYTRKQFDDALRAALREGDS
jgi:hypothetical protein